jgi:hypothetical protein
MEITRAENSPFRVCLRDAHPDITRGAEVHNVEHQRGRLGTSPKRMVSQQALAAASTILKGVTVTWSNRGY